MKIKKIILMLLVILIIQVPVFANNPSEWAEEPINELKETGLFDNDRFNDYKENISREEFIYWAVTLFEIFQNKEIEIDSSISFSDTSDEYALKAATVGITSGTGGGKFSPHQLMDRQTMVTFFVKLMNLGHMNLLEASKEKFSDDNAIDEWAKPFVYQSLSNNIVSGIGNNKFDAKALASKEVCITLTKKVLFESLGKKFTVDGKENVVEIVATETTSDIKILSSIDKVICNNSELELTIKEYKSVSVLSVEELLSHLDKNASVYEYEGDGSYSKVIFNDSEYSFYNNQPYYYKDITKVLYSTKEMNGITIPSNFRAYGEDGQIFVPYSVLFDVLDIETKLEAGVLSFEFGDNLNDIVDDDELDSNGRIEFDFTNDSVETDEGMKAFEEKYQLGQLIRPDTIPTKYALNPDLYAGNGSNVLWESSVGKAYAENPPTVIGKDGSLPPYDEATDVFYKWIMDNDDYIYGEVVQATGEYGGNTPNQLDLDRSVYFYGRVSVWSAYMDDNFFASDGELDPYTSHSIDVYIHNKLWKPTNQVYTKMLLRHYLGEENGLKAYELYNDGWYGDGDVEIAKAYTFGDREILFRPASPQGVSIEIGEPGYSFEDDINSVKGYQYDRTIYNDPFSDNYMPYE